jgi:methylmalonyl-CoA/ethylmalonyl-CoA epimerase
MRDDRTIRTQVILVIRGIDHIGVATADPATVGTFMSALGLRLDSSGVAEAYGVSCEFWRYPAMAGQPAVELVAPAGPSSAVSDRLTRTGPGLYHIAFEVDGIEPELARLAASGFVAIDAVACPGARRGMRVAFMYLRRPAGILIELVEYT